MKCNKYNQQRDLLKKNTKDDFRRIQMLFNTKNLLGMNEKIMMSRKLCEKYKPEIINIYNQVVIYIKNTKRFKVY